jgi:acetolactate synthase small subunit
MSHVEPHVGASELHTIELRLENRPGALYRVLGIVRRHDGNVEHLVVTPAGELGVSRVTLVVRAAEVGQMARQITRLLLVRSIAMPHGIMCTRGGALSTTAARTENAARDAVTHTEER